jgi:hypothetical protein
VISLHDEINERLELRVTDNLVGELRPELAAFLKHLGRAHLLEEVFVPLEATTRTKAAVAYEERPWPPAGIGARALRAMGLAVVSEDGQALLTPVMLAPQHATNVGLAAALTKLLLEDLADAGVQWVALFVNRRSKVVGGELTNAGFEPRSARVLTEQTEFVAYAAEPAAALAALGLTDARLGDVLALNLDRPQVSQLTAFQLALIEGVSNHWAGNTAWAEVFPGFIDWAALPPGGITGTSGPEIEPGDPLIVVTQ